MKAAGILYLLLGIFCLPVNSSADEKLENKIPDTEKGVYFRAVLPTPVYSISDIPSLYYDSDTLRPRIKTDEKGHVRELEFIALKDTKFHFLNSYKYGKHRIYEVTTNDYPVDNKLYIEADFVEQCLYDQQERLRVLPEKTEIVTKLEEMVGVPYRWGGNYAEGIKQILSFYPAGSGAEEQQYVKENQSAWILEGVDCSGMLYQAANGATPRNTSDLVEFGRAVDIEGLSAAEIMQKVEPLDLIVWKGHMLLVFDKDKVIESRPRYDDGHKGGVRIHPLKKRLEEIIATRKPVDDYNEDTAEKKKFVIRRFL